MSVTVIKMLSLLVGYCFGCIQSAFLVGKLIYKIDIRDYGSGNAGTTNVTRTLGAKAGLFVFVFDVIKGAIAFFICYNIFTILEIIQGDLIVNYSLVFATYGGIGAILGHDFPFYLKFRGGKGVATTLGILLCVDYKIALITFVFGIISLLITKYISFASLLMLLIFPIFLKIANAEEEIIILLIFNTILCYYQHRGNIVRLIKGEERKFSVKKV